MYWRGMIRAILGEARAHRTRSLLTVLGIVVGISAVTILLALGDLASQFVGFQLESLAGVKGARVLLPTAEGNASPAPLEMEDLLFLSERADRFENINASPVLRITQNILQRGDRGVVVVVTGVNQEFFSVRRAQVLGGRLLNRGDVSLERPVAVIDEDLLDRLGRPFGPVLDLRGRLEDRLAVVGIIRDGDAEPSIYVPWTRALRHAEMPEAITASMLIHADEPSSADFVAENLTRDFAFRSGRGRLGIAPTPEKDLESAGRILLGIQGFLVAVAGVSLIVGGLGIANVMLMGIRERTKEIGIRRSFGATSRDIRRLFLGESLFLTLIGGAVGAWIGLVVLATAGALLRIQGLPIGVDAPLVGKIIWVVLWLSVLTGFLSGYRPALAASRVPVAEALRTE